MIEEKKHSGGIAGDIQQSRQRKAPTSGQGIGANIPGVTESTNAQGNRSFGAHRQPPKPTTGGITAGFNTGPAGTPRPETRSNPVVSAAKAEAGSGGIAAGMPGFSQLNKGANLPLSGIADGMSTLAKPRATSLGMPGWDKPVSTKQTMQGHGIGKPASGGGGGAGEMSAATPQDNRSATGLPQPSSQPKPIEAPSGIGEKGGGIAGGITETRTVDGRRSFTGTDVGTPGQMNTISMSGGLDASRATSRAGGITDGVGSPQFERALAAGDYEAALQAANQNDVGQMSRLGQLQGNIRSQREAALANSPSAQDRARAETLKQRAMDLASRGFSKGAQRVMGISDGMVKQKGVSSPGTKDILTAQELAAEQADLARQRAESDMAESDATLKRAAVENQGVLQGLIEQMNDPNIGAEQRQSLTQRYQTLSGQSAKDRFVTVDQVVGQGMGGEPVTAKVAIDPYSGQVLGGGAGGGNAGTSDALMQQAEAYADEQIGEKAGWTSTDATDFAAFGGDRTKARDFYMQRYLQIANGQPVKSPMEALQAKHGTR